MGSLTWMFSFLLVPGLSAMALAVVYAHPEPKGFLYAFVLLAICAGLSVHAVRFEWLLRRAAKSSVYTTPA
jgi:hypothetical protein